MAHPAAWAGRIPCHVFPPERIVWVEVPKAASTSIKIALANALRGGDFADDAGLHEWMGYSHADSLDQLREWMEVRWAGWFRFTVVRDPVERFLSLYREKIDPRGFGSVDAWVAANADSFWWDDIHAAPQVCIAGDPTWYDHVGRVEALDETARVLSERTGRDIAFGRHNATAPSAPASGATRELLGRRYVDDLRSFGY